MSDLKGNIMRGYGRKTKQNKFLWMILLTAIVCFASGICHVQADTCKEYYVNTAIDAAKAIQKNWDEEHFEEMLVEAGSNHMKIDGEETTFTNTFAVDSAQMKEVVSSRKNLEAFLGEKEENLGTIYKVSTTEDGNYKISAPYQTRRIVIDSDKVSGNFGAREKYIYSEGRKTILVYGTEQETREAYERVLKVYGEKRCYVDAIISAQKMTQGIASCYSWGGETMGMAALRLNDAFLGNKSVTVAILDSGIDKSSILFKGTEILPTCHNFLTGSNNVSDQYGHGTHVAGIIANLTPDNVKLLVIKILDSSGYGTELSTSLGLDYAISQKADVINMSAGLMDENSKNYTFLDNSINTAYQRGIPICVAAGNDVYGNFGRKVEMCYPASNPQTITVTALDKNMQLDWYSCYGSTVDFCAPGTDINSAWLNGYSKRDSGTSMACPHIAAAMAYIKLMNKNMSVEGCALELRRYCKDLGARGWDSLYGYGCPNIGQILSQGLAYGSWNISGLLAAPWLASITNQKNGVRITWAGSPGATGYYIYRKKEGENAIRLAKVAANVTSYVDLGIYDGDYCSYHVVAFVSKDGAESQSPKSNSLSIASLRPVNIVKVKAMKGKKMEVARSSSRYFYGESIQVQYSNKKNFKKAYTKTFASEKSRYKVSVKKKGVTYVRIRRVFSLGGQKYYSLWSNVKKVKVK